MVAFWSKPVSFLMIMRSWLFTGWLVILWCVALLSTRELHVLYWLSFFFLPSLFFLFLQSSQLGLKLLNSLGLEDLRFLQIYWLWLFENELLKLSISFWRSPCSAHVWTDWQLMLGVGRVEKALLITFSDVPYLSLTWFNGNISTSKEPLKNAHTLTPRLVAQLWCSHALGWMWIVQHGTFAKNHRELTHLM